MRAIGLVGFLVLLAELGGAAVSGRAGADDSAASAILARLDRVAIPRLDIPRKGDPAYLRQFLADREAATHERNALIGQLYAVSPRHERIPALMAERWSIRASGQPGDEVEREASDVLAHPATPALRVEAALARVSNRLYDRKAADPALVAEVEDLARIAPTDPRNASVWQLLITRLADLGAQEVWRDRLVRDWPDSLEARQIVGQRHRAKLIGQPFDLEFTDIVSGQPVSLAKLRGKVVVLDFWASWCAPCVAEMPRMKELHARYQDRGVAFVGISLDLPEADGGLDRLHRFVREQQIPWPQFYLGDDFSSPFAVACGITSIPAVFVLDAEGRVVSTDAGGELDALLARLTGAKTDPQPASP